MAVVCDRCGSTMDVTWFEECETCGPVLLCDLCITLHREEMKSDA